MYLNSHPDLEVKGVIYMAKVTRCLLREMRMILAHAKLATAMLGCFWWWLPGCFYVFVTKWCSKWLLLPCCYVALKCSEAASLKMPECLH